MISTAVYNDIAMNEMRNWYALSVMSRQEFITSKELIRKGVEVFAPAITRIRQWSDRKKAVEMPLFPGYLFVRLKRRSEEFMNVMTTRGAVRFVSFAAGVPEPVLHEEIESLKTLVASGRAMEILPGVHVGDHVRIRRGPLAGVCGVISQQRGAQVFIVNIDILGRCVATTLTDEEVELA